MKPENSMVALVEDYLAFRRSLGFALRDDKDGGELLGFGRYADKIKHRGRITTELAVQWASGTGHTAPIYGARRLNLLRGFAQHRASIDSETDVLPRGL